MQLNVGYRIKAKHVICSEFKISIFSWPLGIPFGPSFDAPVENYHGHASTFALILGCQRFWRKGINTSVHLLNAFEKYIYDNDKMVGNGYK